MKQFLATYRWYLGATVLAFIAAGSAVVWSLQTDGAPEERREATPVAVEVIDLSGSTAGRQIEANGEVESRAQATLSAQRGGVIDAVYVEIGDQVNRGQVLVRFDNKEARANLAQARASLEAARSREQSSDLAMSNAELDLQNAVQSARTTLNDIKETKVAQFFEDEQDLNNFGVEITQGSTSYFIRARSATEENNITEAADQFVAKMRALRKAGGDPEREAAQAERTLLVLRELVDHIGGVLERYSAESTADQAVYSPYRGDISAARSSLSSSLTSLRKAVQAYRNSRVSDSEAQVKQAAAQVQAAESRLAQGVVRAPFSGTVTAVTPNVGESVTVGRSLVTLVNEGRLQITLGLSPAAAKRISVGDSATVGGAYAGRVSAVSRAVNEDTGKVEITVGVTDPAARLIVGEFVDVALKADTEEGVAYVPLSAVKTTGEGSYVFTVREGAAVRQQIEIGSVVGNAVTVTRGLDGVQRVIAEASSVADGVSVTVTGTR